jgi:hypothetical protein
VLVAAQRQPVHLMLLLLQQQVLLLLGLQLHPATAGTQ